MTASEPWRRVVQYRRHVICPRPCGYLGEELWEKGGTASGFCTKCGHTWKTPLPAPPNPLEAPDDTD